MCTLPGQWQPYSSMRRQTCLGCTLYGITHICVHYLASDSHTVLYAGRLVWGVHCMAGLWDVWRQSVGRRLAARHCRRLHCLEISESKIFKSIVKYKMICIKGHISSYKIVEIFWFEWTWLQHSFTLNLKASEQEE